ncbi:hypothetical protein KUTeg_010778 [Tegillarca granosa]|uniref:Aminopeptidase n=1 Tax=Tegillarca granosa TaxID=220873 RepID=A0ABQ9F203_TEGGR|nr:hypothetical protein KUTeg_010778 [Tegillarca granosa]
MDKQKEFSGMENGMALSNNIVENSITKTVTKDTMVTLAQPRKGCYFSRVQVAIFTVAFLLTILTVVLLLSFVRKEQVIYITSPKSFCACTNYSETEVKINVTKSEEFKNTSQSLTAENLTQTENTSVSGKKSEKSGNKTEKYPWDEIRLPRYLLPIHYDIELWVDLENKDFQGQVNMTIYVNASTKYIMFHINHLVIDFESVRISELNSYPNENLKIVRQLHVWRHQFHVIELETELTPGIKYIVRIGNYTGKIVRDLKGLYLSSYVTTDGQVRYLAATQLQSTDARKVFPCMDEPDMKATYKVTIVHKREQFISPDKIRVTFHKTPKMSTYLLAIVVSDFEYKESIFDDGYQPNKINQTIYALNVSEKIYEFFIDYFQINDVVTKSDHVAVPDFSGGAMENWGLVIYRETALLFDPEVSSSQNQLMVTLIVAHEIAHTWFGNMVTMKWWDDLWLNEGFASLLMYFAMDYIYPDWNVFTLNVVVKEVFTVMVKDALTTSHPVSTPIRTPDDIAQFFDTISYSKLRVWSQPNKINQTIYALNVSEKIYEFFIDYFQINDVVTKSDHVAVPDFSGGAMENWGLVIYRETALLFDPEVSSSQNQLMVTLIVAHEIAHTWFGNMVTMKWWDDLWLNEGFASLLMYFAMDYIYPDWNFTLNVVVKEVFTVMVKDALTTSHPVSTPIRTPDDIAQFFDTISYSKGMAVLRMLLEFVGWEDFRRGLQMYVNRYKFKNAEMDELWETFSEAVDHRFDIKAIMDTWTRQMGYPVVTMRSDGDSYVLEQQRFLLDGNNSVNDSIYKWRIPFTYMTKDIPLSNPSLVWLHMESATIPKDPDTWIIGNVKYTGFYRVNYEPDMWRMLAEQLNRDHTVFHEANKAGFIGDSFNFARAGILDYDVALNMTTYLNNEELYVPWKAFLDSIEFIRGMLYLRQIILTTACDVGVKKAVKYAKDLFTKWKDEGVPVPTLYSMVVYSVGVREGSVEEWDHVWNKSLTTNVAAEREMLLEALAYTQKPWLLWRYANWIFDSNKIKMQDVRLVVSYFAKSPLGRMIALHLLMNKWDKLNEQFGQDTFLLRETISEVTQFVNTEFELNQLATLFKDKPPQVARKEAENSLELIRANIKWMETNYDIISDWLRDHVVGML